MLELLSFIVGCCIGASIYYLKQGRNRAIAPLVLNNTVDNTHMVEVRVGRESYSDMSISINGVTCGEDKTFTKYFVRDAVVAFHLVKYNEALDRQSSDLLEAIGTARVDCVKTIDGKKYTFKFTTRGC